MRYLLALLLVFALLSYSFVNVGIAVYYHLNVKSITAKYCINKDKPQMHCNGHCYLAKELKQAEKREHQSNHNLMKMFSEIVMDQPTKYVFHVVAFSVKCRWIPSKSKLYLPDSYGKIDQPP